jgi:hypothetical protein
VQIHLCLKRAQEYTHIQRIGVHREQRKAGDRDSEKGLRKGGVKQGRNAGNPAAGHQIATKSTRSLALLAGQATNKARATQERALSPERAHTEHTDAQ